MSDTYCGKSCEDCSYKDNLGCMGCKEGPGRTGLDSCKLAMCCKEKGHKACDTCGHNLNCNTLRERHNMPQYRLEKLELETERKKRTSQKAPFLGKWYSALFWLLIPSIISGLLTGDSIASHFPALYWFGEILGLISTVAYCMILFILSSENNNYRTAGICGLAVEAISWITTFLSNLELPSGLLLLILLLSLAAALFEKYYEYNGHMEVAADIDGNLSQKWNNLWKWFIRTALILMGATILLFLIPIIGLVIVLGTMIAIIILDFLKLKYLQQMAKEFKAYQ